MAVAWYPLARAVSGFGIRVSGFGIRVSGFGFQVSGLGCPPSYARILRYSRGVVLTEAGSDSRLIDSCIPQLEAQGPARTCNESKVEGGLPGSRSPSAHHPARRISRYYSAVSGFGFRDSGFGIRVSGFGFRDSGFEIQVLGFGFRVSGFGCMLPAILRASPPLLFRLAAPYVNESFLWLALFCDRLLS